MSFKKIGFILAAAAFLVSAQAQALTYTFKQIPAGTYMAWSISTQAMDNVCVTLQDDSGTTYVNGVCRQSTAFGTLDEGFARVVGGNLTVTVTVSGNESLLSVPNEYKVSDGQDTTVGWGANLLIEDSGDHDYNDALINIMAWKSAH